MKKRGDAGFLDRVGKIMTVPAAQKNRDPVQRAPNDTARSCLSMTGSYDVAVIGAGVLGLWLARFLDQAGARVVVLERGQVAEGASGGLLGALQPHMPSGWNAKKQFQLEALEALPQLAAELATETGIDIGYRRCGRISPIRKPGFLRQTEAHVRQHGHVWRQARYRLAAADAFAHWLDPDSAPLGLAHETLSARLNPRAYCRALQASLSRRVQVLQGTRFLSFDANRGNVRLAGAAVSELRAGQLVLAAGVDSFALLAPWLGAEIGAGVAGHVAVLAAGAAVPDDVPMIYDDGTYIVPRGAGRVAVGSGCDTADLARKVARARALCPVLRKAPVVATWSARRPRCHAKDPLVGQVPGQPVFVATGGYKITLGIAHHMARALVGRMAGAPNPRALPQSYTMAYHLEKCRERHARAKSS